RLKDWQGAASEIADYVATWGVERFWAMSRSLRLIDGKLPDANSPKEEERRYFAWGVARVALCNIVKDDLGIQDTMTVREFQEKFSELSFNRQMILVDLLIEIASTIQFWTMRLKDASDKEV
ncbi:MAG: hypothetical protein SVX43_07920, partial [Cyanobacteriota bacterium]|nr:hypothetical protein [Cyanobacteriota bacterium]